MCPSASTNSRVVLNAGLLGGLAPLDTAAGPTEQGDARPSPCSTSVGRPHRGTRWSTVLGIDALYHETTAATLVVDGEIVAATQEERFTRRKHDPAMPVEAMRWCLDHAGTTPGDIDLVVYYEKPLTKFVRILRTHSPVRPARLPFVKRRDADLAQAEAVGVLRDEKALRGLGHSVPRKGMCFTEHHESHAATAFFPSPFESAAILTFDGVGEWATSSIGHGRGNRIELLRQMDFPDSLGLLYSAFTYYCGFHVNSGEYKLMGLAPYGTPRYTDQILTDLVDLAPDGSFRLDQRYFGYLAGDRMISKRFERLFGRPARPPESRIEQLDLDLAASIQQVTEDIVLRMAHTAADLTGETRAVLAGGVALNCVANGRLSREGPFDEIWVQPAAGDTGGALGATLYGWHQLLDGPREVDGVHDRMHGSLLGPTPGTELLATHADHEGLPYERLDRPARDRLIAEHLAAGRIVAVVQGPMEFGPRALGSRSILGDPRDTDVSEFRELSSVLL